MSLRVLNLYTPVSWTLIDTTNNTLVINTTTYTLTVGNYNSSSLITMLSSILPNTYTVTFNSTTNKLTITNSTSDFTFKATSTSLTILGFASGADVSSSSNTLTSPYPIDLTGQNMIYLDCQNLITVNLNNGTRTSILRSFLCDVAYGGVLYFTSQSEGGSCTIQEDHIGWMHIRLLGEDALTPLDLQNQNWSCTLEVGYVPKQQPTLSQGQPSPQIKEMFSKYIQSLLSMSETYTVILKSADGIGGNNSKQFIIDWATILPGQDVQRFNLKAWFSVSEASGDSSIGNYVYATIDGLPSFTWDSGKSGRSTIVAGAQLVQGVTYWYYQKAPQGEDKKITVARPTQNLTTIQVVNSSGTIVSSSLGSWTLWLQFEDCK